MLKKIGSLHLMLKMKHQAKLNKSNFTTFTIGLSMCSKTMKHFIANFCDLFFSN